MDGYNNVFKHSAHKFDQIAGEHPKKIFQAFRMHKELFAFLENGDSPPDYEAISIAKSIDENMYNHYLEELKDRKNIGYRGSSSKYASYNNLDSRHIMMSTILFHNITENINSVLEIGGGYGNWLYLNRNRKFSKWTIIDIPHVHQLQKWALKQLDVDPSRYKLFPSTDCKEAEKEVYDMVIGTHSLSEFAIEIFVDYFYRFVKKAKYLFYCYHKTLPSEPLIKLKRRIIDEYFVLVYEINSEGGDVANCIFKNKN